MENWHKKYTNLYARREKDIKSARPVFIQVKFQFVDFTYSKQRWKLLDLHCLLDSTAEQRAERQERKAGLAEERITRREIKRGATSGGRSSKNVHFLLSFLQTKAVYIGVQF